jgi:hypothetical protein
LGLFADACIGNADAVRIAAQIAEDLIGATEGRC